MRELHGVLPENYPDINDLKQKALLFDHFHMRRLNLYAGVRAAFGGLESLATLQFLVEKRLISEIPFDVGFFDGSEDQLHELERLQGSIEYAVESPNVAESVRQTALSAFQAFDIRQTCIALNKLEVLSAVPMDDFVPDWQTMAALNLGPGRSVDGARVAIRQLPVPDATAAWQDIFDFKSESKGKLWHFRRFIHDVTCKRQTESEICDDIQWSLHNYTEAMDRFKIKRSISFMETYVIPTVEALENFKPSSVLKGVVAFKKKKLERLEGDVDRPGCECAYVFDARKRFGKPTE